MANLNLVPLDELITARKTLHGGTRGAPIKLADGTREGDALNRACVVALSGALQCFVEDVFVECSNKQFGKILAGDELLRYRKTWARWGNPDPDNITKLFRRIGVDNVLLGLSWPKQTTETWKNNLKKVNQIRNCIAHGKEIRVDGNPYALHLSVISRWRKSAEQFGNRFQAHAEAKIP